MAEPFTQRKFLGKGLKYPFQFTRRTGGVFVGTTVSSSEEIAHIGESIMQILGTRITSRVIRRDFGSLLRGVVFDPNDPTLDIRLEHMIRVAIERWEPRVIVGPLLVNRDERLDGRLELDITFTIIKTNTQFNLVFPFFLDENERKTFVTPGR